MTDNPEQRESEVFVLVPRVPTEAMLEAGDVARPFMSDHIWSAMIAAAPSTHPPVQGEVGRLREEVRAEIINTPETADFMAGVPLEAAHQRERWGAQHDGGKTPFDWFWLIGYLAQKAASAQASGDGQKAMHHTISTAAALANWHAQIAGRTDMRPGIGPGNGGEKAGSAYNLAAALNAQPSPTPSDAPEAESATPAPEQSLAIPAGMKPWAGGDSAPTDWDGGPVLLRGDNNHVQSTNWRWSTMDRPLPGGAAYDIVAYTPKPEQSDTSGGERYLADRFKWAAPGDRQEDAWLVKFCDSDIRDALYTGPDAEREAWAAWERHAPGYNMYLFRLAALSQPTSAEDEVDRRDMAAALRNTPAEALREAGYLDRTADMLERQITGECA